MEYIKDWKIWVLCFVLFLIITISDWAWAGEPHKNWKRFEVEPEKPKTESVQFRPMQDLKFRWKFNKVEGKYKIVNGLDFRTNFVVSDNLDVKAVSLFTLEF